MAVRLLSHDVSDLCLGKPALKSLPISATVDEALSALKRCGETCLGVWSCDHSLPEKKPDSDGCQCVGKVCVVDIVCYLCREENILNPASALKSPLSVLIPKLPGQIRLVDPHFSLLEALDLILDGAQNLIVPIQSSISTRRKKLPKSQSNATHANGREFCWLTQEDVVRFLLNSIGVFSPLPALAIESLGIIRTDILTVGYHNPALSAVDSICLALCQQTSVAVVSPDGTLIGEISPSTLAACDESVAPVITVLSAGELMAYIDCGGPPEDLVRTVKLRLKGGNLQGMLKIFGEDSTSSSSSSCTSASSSSSSDDESWSPTGMLPRRSRYSRAGSYSARMGRRAEAIVCHPGSSLVAVMIQALAHRVNYVWVIDDEYNLVGIVTFSDVLKVFREHLESFE